MIEQDKQEKEKDNGNPYKMKLKEFLKNETNSQNEYSDY